MKARPLGVRPKRRTRRRHSAAATFLVAALATGCTTAGASSTGAKGYITGEGAVTTIAAEDRRDAPGLRGERLGGGGEISLDDYAGRVVVVNVWASWCAPCRAEAADLVAVATDLPEVRFLGLNVRDQEAAAEAFVRQQAVRYPSLVSQDGALMLEFYGLLNLASIPSTVVIDAQGRIAALVLGRVDAETLRGLVTSVGGES